MPTPDSSEYYAELLNSQLTFDAPDTAGRRLPLRGGDDPPGPQKQSGSESKEVARPKPLSINQLLKSSPMSNDKMKGNKSAPSPARSNLSITSWADEVEMSEDKRQAKEARRAEKAARKEQAKLDRIADAEERRKNGEAPPQPCVNCAGNHWSQDCTTPAEPTEPTKGKSKKEKKRQRKEAAAAAAAARNSSPDAGDSAPATDEAEDAPERDDEDEDLPEPPSNEEDNQAEPAEQSDAPPSNQAGAPPSSPTPTGLIGLRPKTGATLQINAGREGARRLSTHAAKAAYEQATGQPWRGQPTQYPDLSDLRVGPTTPSHGTREQNAAFTHDTVTSNDVVTAGATSLLDRSRRQLNQFDTGNTSSPASATASVPAPRSSSKRRLTASATPRSDSSKRTVKARGPAPAGTPTIAPAPKAKTPALPLPKVNMTKRKEDTRAPANDPSKIDEEVTVLGATRYSEGRHLYLRMHEDLMEGRSREAYHLQIMRAVVDQGLLTKMADWESCQWHDKKGGWVATATTPEVADQCAGKRFMVNERPIDILPFQSTNPRAFFARNTSIFPDVRVAERLAAIQQIPNWVKWWVGRDSCGGTKGSYCFVVFDGPTNISDFDLPLGRHGASSSMFTAHFRAVKTGDKCMICGENHQGKGTLGCTLLDRMEIPAGQDMPSRTLRDMPQL